jgi:hypothetical protein
VNPTEEWVGSNVQVPLGTATASIVLLTLASLSMAHYLRKE